MKIRVRAIAAGVLGTCGAVWAFFQVAATPAPPLATLAPSGAILYVETQNLSGLLKEWNATPEKAAWLKSDNYQVFSRSKLFTRLSQAQDEFAAAAGFPPSLASLENVAGGQSALAIYDIGAMHFVMVTRLPAGRTLPAVLTKARPAYQARKAGNYDYWVATAKDTGRVAAFGQAGNLLVLGTREDLVSGTLRLVAGQANLPLARDAWFERIMKVAPQAGEIRLAGNLGALVKSPHFRSYWVQQNITELGQYSAFVSDIRRSSGELREERTLVRATIPDVAPGASRLGELLPLVPANSGFYRAWMKSTPEEATRLLTEKVLVPRSELRLPLTPERKDSNAQEPPPPPPAESAESEGMGDDAAVVDSAPEVPDTGTAASAADLRTRIDEPPVTAVETRLQLSGLTQALTTTSVEAVLQVEGTKTLADGVFVTPQAAIALLGNQPWKGDEIRRQLASSLAALFSTGQLGFAWTARNTGGTEWHVANGLHPLAVAVRGKTLIIANDPALVEAMLSRPASATGSDAVYVASYNHARELPMFTRLMRMLDTGPREGATGERMPLFFSENMASFGQTLKRMETATVTVRDTGETVPQTVVYRFASR